MNRRFAAEAATIIIAAVLCALVANAVASRDRKMALVGSYTNALKVPAQTATPAPPPGPAPETATVPETVVKPSNSVAPVTSTHAPTVSKSTPATTTTVQTTTSAAPAKPALQPADSADLLKRFPPHDKVPYVELHGDDVAYLYKRGVLFLDARRTNVYEEGHIAGARSFPVWESDIGDRINALLAENRDQKQPIVIYCSGGDCEDSHMLAEKLWGVFFNNAWVYKDGFPDWQKRGGAIHTGANP